MIAALRRSAAHVFVESLDAPVLNDDDAHHLGRVLRLRAGETVSAADGRGQWRPCAYSSGALEPSGPVAFVPAPIPSITIGFAVPKGDRPEWIVQKLTEIGVERIIVLHAARSVVRWEGERAERQVARLRKVAVEAAMQSRRVWLPHVDGPLRAGDVDSPVALAEPDGEPLTLETPTVLIGPEGGWSDDELALSPSRCALGDTVLRVETAALVAATRLVTLREAVHGH